MDYVLPATVIGIASAFALLCFAMGGRPFCYFAWAITSYIVLAIVFKLNLFLVDAIHRFCGVLRAIHYWVQESILGVATRLIRFNGWINSHINSLAGREDVESCNHATKFRNVPLTDQDADTLRRMIDDYGCSPILDVMKHHLTDPSENRDVV